MHTPESIDSSAPHEPWYKYGVAFLFFEMLLALVVCGYSLYLTFHGLGSMLSKH